MKAYSEFLIAVNVKIAQLANVKDDVKGWYEALLDIFDRYLGETDLEYRKLNALYQSYLIRYMKMPANKADLMNTAEKKVIQDYFTSFFNRLEGDKQIKEFLKPGKGIENLASNLPSNFKHAFSNQAMEKTSYTSKIPVSIIKEPFFNRGFFRDLTIVGITLLVPVLFKKDIWVAVFKNLSTSFSIPVWLIILLLVGLFIGYRFLQKRKI